MVTLLTLGGLALAVLAVVFAAGLVLFLLKLVVLLVLLPLKLLAGAVLFPIRLIGGLIGVLFLPMLALLAVGAAVVAGLFALALPLLPLAVVVGIVWLIVKATSQPALARR